MKVAFQVYGQSRGASDGNWDMVSVVLHCQASSLHQLEVANTKLTTELTMPKVYQCQGAEEEERGLEKEIRAWEAKQNSTLGGQNAKSGTSHSPFPLLTLKPIMPLSCRT